MALPPTRSWLLSAFPLSRTLGSAALPSGRFGLVLLRLCDFPASLRYGDWTRTSRTSTVLSSLRSRARICSPETLCFCRNSLDVASCSLVDFLATAYPYDLCLRYTRSSWYPCLSQFILNTVRFYCQVQPFPCPREHERASGPRKAMCGGFIIETQVNISRPVPAFELCRPPPSRHLTCPQAPSRSGTTGPPSGRPSCTAPSLQKGFRCVRRGWARCKWERGTHGRWCRTRRRRGRASCTSPTGRRSTASGRRARRGRGRARTRGAWLSW